VLNNTAPRRIIIALAVAALVVLISLAVINGVTLAAIAWSG
jgi:hypothetical protein